MKIGILLLKMRKERRLSQHEVAEHVGVCQSAYCAWESDRSVPNARYYGSLVALFGVELKDLLPAGPALGSPPLPVPSPATPAPPASRDELVTAQREALALQKQWIEHLEIENGALRQRLAETGKAISVPLLVITAIFNFISLVFEPISGLIATC